MEASKILNGLSPSAWGGLFVSAMIGTGVAARLSDLGDFWSMAVMLPPMLLLIPLVRASQRQARASSALTPAIKAYNRRSLVWSFAYVFALFAAMSIDKAYDPQGPLAYLVAILPALPIFYFIWALGRYLSDEQDEYIRMRQVRAALIATAIVLGLGTFWGFLEMFALVPHVWAWWVVPVWAMGLGIGNLVNARSGL
jgi:hypothetical protein